MCETWGLQRVVSGLPRESNLIRERRRDRASDGESGADRGASEKHVGCENSGLHETVWVKYQRKGIADQGVGSKQAEVLGLGSRA